MSKQSALSRHLHKPSKGVASQEYTDEIPFITSSRSRIVYYYTDNPLFVYNGNRVLSTTTVDNLALFKTFQGLEHVSRQIRFVIAPCALRYEINELDYSEISLSKSVEREIIIKRHQIIIDDAIHNINCSCVLTLKN